MSGVKIDSKVDGAEIVILSVACINYTRLVKLWMLFLMKQLKGDSNVEKDVLFELCTQELYLEFQVL